MLRLYVSTVNILHVGPLHYTRQTVKYVSTLLTRFLSCVSTSVFALR